jgi:hypothetical protein
VSIIVLIAAQVAASTGWVTMVSPMPCNGFSSAFTQPTCEA